MKAPAWKQGLAARKPGGEEEKADRDAAPSHGSKYRDYEPKRRDSMEYKEPVYYGGSARRRQEESASDGYRRHYEADEHSRHSRYAERDHYSDSRAYRGGRYDRRSYEDDRGHYGESRTYRSSRYDDHPKYRKSSYHYDDRDHYSDRYDRYDRYERYDRYDRYRRSGRSYSPQTPYSDRRSPNPRKAYYSPPPPPPSDAVPVAKAPPVGEPGATKRERASNPVAAAPPGPGGAGPAAGHGQAKAREEPKAADASQKKESKIPDPRAGTNLYAARMTTALEIVSLPRVAAADASLASPPFDMQAEWRAPNPSAGAFQSPLERINAYLCTPRPQVSREWWLKGTLSLLMLGIPRQWQVQEALLYLMETYDRLLSWEDVITDECESDGGADAQAGGAKRDYAQWCQKVGLHKFMLLFGEQGVAVNELPAQFPRVAEQGGGAPAAAVKSANVNEHPDAMALLVFESELHAMQFWSTVATNCIKAYPSTIMVCPDPSGWRVYTEALAHWFHGEVLLQLPQAQPHAAAKDKPNEDFLPVLTNKGPEDSAQKHKSVSQLTFVSPYVARAEDANDIANSLAKSGIKCMYHKPSKIMSLQFPNETLFSTLAVCHRFFTSPSGARVHCCFIKCLGKFLPLVKRTNVEHLSNAVEKSKTAPPKPSKPGKFKPPSVGIVTIEQPLEELSG